MATVKLRLGPADHGRPLSLDDYEAAGYQPGHKYEIVDGRLYVSPEANFAEGFLENWLRRKLECYSDARPDVINYVAPKSRVFVHKRKKATVPEPDLSAYHDLPLDLDVREVHWRDLNPSWLPRYSSRATSGKTWSGTRDCISTSHQFGEYWVLDGRADPNEPTLIQHRRYGGRWVVREYPYGATFATKLLPGFTLLIDPRK